MVVLNKVIAGEVLMRGWGVEWGDGGGTRSREDLEGAMRTDITVKVN